MAEHIKHVFIVDNIAPSCIGLYYQLYLFTVYVCTVLLYTINQLLYFELHKICKINCYSKCAWLNTLTAPFVGLVEHKCMQIERCIHTLRIPIACANFIKKFIQKSLRIHWKQSCLYATRNGCDGITESFTTLSPPVPLRSSKQSSLLP